MVYESKSANLLLFTLVFALEYPAHFLGEYQTESYE